MLAIVDNFVKLQDKSETEQWTETCYEMQLYIQCLTYTIYLSQICLLWFTEALKFTFIKCLRMSAYVYGKD